MKKLWTLFLTLFTLGTLSTAFAQEQHHGDRHPLWPDSLGTTEVTGTVIIDSSFYHAEFSLDEDGDGQADYHLAFGPWWYQPESGATRPAAGEVVTVEGLVREHFGLPSLVVFEINGLTWREPVAYGRHGWNSDAFWDNQGDTLTVAGVAMIDTSYFYAHYFLDTNNDSIPEYRLGFGPPWYQPASGASRPGDGDVVIVFGRVREMAGINTLSVYDIDGLAWRSPDQPAPWAGMWVGRNRADTTIVYCVTDSGNWVTFVPGHMGHGGMGGMLWPDSAFVQFWEIHPDSLPGGTNGQHFRGFFLNIHDPQGMGMMNGTYGGHQGAMHLEQESEFRFHYDDANLAQRGLSESGIKMKYWDDATQQWHDVAGINVDTGANTVTFSTADLSQYYTLSAPSSVAGFADAENPAIPGEFVLQQNYPNPFNPSTTIRFALPEHAAVQLSVYNLLGQRITLLVNEPRAAGVHSVQWNGTDDSGRPVSSGIYLVRLEAGEQVQMQRMTLLK